MIFTRIGKAAAWILVIFGAFMMAAHVLVHMADSPEEFGTLALGATFSYGLYGLLIGLFLGVLCEISNHLNAAARKYERQGPC